MPNWPLNVSILWNQKINMFNVQYWKTVKKFYKHIILFSLSYYAMLDTVIVLLSNVDGIK